MHTYETSEIKLYIQKNGSEPIQSVNKKLHISDKSFHLLKNDYKRRKNKRNALVQELEIGARKVCVNNKLHRNLDYYL